MATLYELTSDYLEILNMASDPEIPSDVITNTLEGINEEIELKAQNYAIVIKELQGKTEMIKSEEKRLSDKRKVIENNVKRIKENLYNSMKLTGKEKFKTMLFSFNIQKSPVKLIIDDIDLIPKKYYTILTPQLNESLLKDDLKSGKKCKYAHLEQGEHVRIR